MGRIDTEIVRLADDHAIIAASISVPGPGGTYIKLADAMKREDAKHFQDYLEKCQTAAVGRALALCGYGSQFAPEVDEDDHIVDSPSDRPASPPRPAVNKEAPTHQTQQQTQPQPAQALPTHVQALIDSAKAAKIKKADLEQLISLRYPECPTVKSLDQAQCKTLIQDILKLPQVPPVAKGSEPPSSDPTQVTGG